MASLSNTQGADWQEVAKIYKQLTVSVSNRPIEAMLDKANALLPFSEATGIHDSGCGPGPVLSRLISKYGAQLPQDCTLSASDFSSGMIEQMEQVKKEEADRDPSSPWSRVETSVLDAMDLKGIEDGSKSHVTAGWVYFMTSSPQKCLAESLRVLKTGGALTCSSWEDSQWMQLMKLVHEVRPDAPVMKIPEEWQSTRGLQTELEQAGFSAVEAVQVEVEMHFDSYDALLDLLTTKLPHMVKTLSTWSQHEVARLRNIMEGRLREFCPTAPGKMTGVALVAVGRKA
ncbi:Putative methyltransferase type 11, S-adenosyl-L-methionine-dependent methyltransferase [Septoria linicola]|uniref:Methyltransferase type 11, S-adenosyl-L-methionine-dependent methyltransferase n=1 Tax=Septoria linicola TaxID=215465 RepID=A0A9Q9EG23_9PEZI|nr:putative methyltransferase type 11, S-adenosyl-L-methionine-dependent methyltransferase [Septoria linicola]USW48272.1 Putative methyltransferase type 11, S-adenosyl-L-methionine-dependent methyltransferase [Septoria linicola]